MFSSVCFNSTLLKSVCVFVDFAEDAIPCKFTSSWHFTILPHRFLCQPPSSRHGFVLSPERTNECGPFVTRGGPLHKYSHGLRRGDTFPAFSKLVYWGAAKEKLKMMNGEINGFHNSLIEEDCFLFTSESVGEGHPGKMSKLNCRRLYSIQFRYYITAPVLHVHCNKTLRYCTKIAFPFVWKHLNNYSSVFRLNERLSM